MKKTFYALFLLILMFVSIPCSSASFAFAENVDVHETNAFRIVRKSYADGHISLTYIFPLNSDMMKKEGFSDDEVKVFRFYLTSYANALAKSNAENVCQGVAVENSKYFTDVDGIGYSIVFENLDAQKRFFGVQSDDSSSSGGQKTSGFFFKKTKINSTFPVSSQKTAGDLKMICLMAISSWSNNSSMLEEKKAKLVSNYDNSVFIYDFASQTKGIKSDVMYQDENFFHNVFVKTYDEIETSPGITFWVTSVNTPVWYIGAIVVVVIGMSCAWVGAKVVKKKKKIA